MDWPECETCEGRGEVFGDIHPPHKMHSCPACNGTGERDLTADEAAEYLKDKIDYWEAYYDCPENPYNVATVEFNEEGYRIGSIVIGDGETLTLALQSAARAVRSKG